MGFRRHDYFCCLLFHAILQHVVGVQLVLWWSATSGFLS